MPGVIERKIPWLIQPQQPVGIDLNNRYGASLITGLNGGYGPTTSAKSSQLTTTAGAGRSPGLVTYSGAAGNRSDYGLLQPTGAFAIVARLRKPTAHVNNSAIFDNKRVSEWATALGLEFNIRADQGVLFKVGTAETYTTTNLFGDTAFHTVTAIFDPGTQQDFYVDGVKPTYAASAIASSYTASPLTLISGSYYDLAVLRSGASEIEYAYLLNGKFTLKELNQLHATPWQIFQPIQRKMWVASAGGGATVIEADAASSGTSTTSGVSGATAGSAGASTGAAVVSGVSGAVLASDASSAGASTASADAENAGTGGTIIESTASSAGSSTASGISGVTAGSTGTASGQATANGVGDGGAVVEEAIVLGGGIKRKKEEKKQYLVDGVLRNLSDAEVTQIMSQPSAEARPAPKIVLEDKPVDKPLTKGLKEWKIKPTPEAEPAKTKKPVFAKESLKVENERVIVQLVAQHTSDTDEDDEIIEHLLAREMKRRAMLSKSLTQLYAHLTGGR